MIQKLRNSNSLKGLSALLVQVLMLQIVFPSVAMAQAGPGQAETKGFSLATTSSMVDDFTGDFSYSIPLLDIDGYAINLVYNANVTMFQEASWVGLGWDLNVGSISRDMRGIPDDFNGTDEVLREVGMKDYESNGQKQGGRFSIGRGIMSVGVSLLYGQYMNSYNGPGVTWDYGLNSGVNLGENLSFNWGVGFTQDSQNGIGRNNSLGVNGRKTSLGISQQFSSREGLKSTNIQLSGIVARPLPGRASLGLKGSTTATYSLGTQTSVPRFNYPTYGTNGTTTHTGTGIASLANVVLSASYVHSDYYFKDLVTDNKQIIKSAAYGYYHMGKGQRAPASQRPMMDFNRERDGDFSEEMVKLPFSAPTYDFFNVSALGIAGSVRGQRNDMGTLQDPIVNTQNKGKNKEYEYRGGYTAPNGVILGFSYGQGDVTSEGASGKWETSSSPFLKWSPLEKNGIEEGVFFKPVGEATPRNMEQWNSLNGAATATLKLKVVGEEIVSDEQISAGGQDIDVSGLGGMTPEKAVRAMYYNPVTAANYSLKTNGNKIRYQQENDWENPQEQFLNRVTDLRKGHHISAVEATSVEGFNYYFDIPVYNINQSDVVFNATGLKGALYTSKGMVAYSGSDNTVNNNRGKSGFFEKTTVPGYAHSYLLSLMTSSDYMDRSGDGPSTDDFGNYYKFNYTPVYDGSANKKYKWRFPYERSTAKLIEGHKSTPFDDVATYAYGEKEIWYVKSIETKNYIVEFHLNNTNTPRKDGYGVFDENGGLNAETPLRRLEKIVVYSRNDRMNNGNAAVPLQTVTMSYDYSLCKGNPSNVETIGGNFSQSGKLTLKSIQFSGGLSDAVALAPYEFDYGYNPDFSYINVDRWGGYKPNDAVYNNIDYPFAIQNEQQANLYAQSWKLNTIHTPAAGKMAIAYEADRYAYTQDKRVMNMFRVLGMSSKTQLDQNVSNGSASYGPYLRDPGSNLKNLKDPHHVIYFALQQPLTGSTAERKAQLLKQYLRDETGSTMKELFFQVRTKIDPAHESSYENILGFAELTDDYGTIGTGAAQVGYVVLAKVDVKDKDGVSEYKVNPVQKAAWQYARLNVLEIIYGNCDFGTSPLPSDCDYDNDLDAAVVFGANLNKQLNKKEYCKQFDPVHSFVRMYDPRGYVFGGNARVKSITYSDNWDSAAAPEAGSEYKWEYLYDHADQKEYNGVAAYEPSLGNTVNPFYKWTTYKRELKQFPDESMITIEPVGELLFPAPVVGYGKVRVKFGDIANLHNNAVGEKLTTFFTAKDKPTKVIASALDKSARIKKTALLPAKEIRMYGLSQGYTVLTNNFHGQIRQEETRDAYGALIQRSKYKYSDENLVSMLDRDGSLKRESIAAEYDVYADARFIDLEARTQTFGVGVDVVWYVPMPIVPSPFINLEKNRTRKGFFAHTINKHLNQSAVVEAVETEYLGSANSAKNLVYDRYSGNVIVSSLKDEFNDPLFSIAYPAHWYYPNMENKYINEHLALNNVTISNGIMNAGSAAAAMVPGDVFSIAQGGLNPRGAWALIGGNPAGLIDESGNIWNTGSQQYDAQLTQSGRKNRLTEMMKQVTTKHNPLSGTTFTFPDKDNIYAVTAVEYDNSYSIPCYLQHDREVTDKATDYEYVLGSGMKVNPFVAGIMGNPRLVKQFAFKSERLQHDKSIRVDGAITDYAPFYALANGKWYKIDELGHPNNPSKGNYGLWREMQRVSAFDAFGKPTTAKDPLDISAVSLYGFNARNQLLPVAQAVNARLNQIAYDGFEDRDYLPNSTMVTRFVHFDFLETAPAGVSVTSEQRHSGLKSLKILPGNKAHVRRLVKNSCTDPAGEHVSGGEYQVHECDCIPQFSPSPGKYVVSAWVKVLKAGTSYSQFKVTVINAGTVVFTPSGPVIDGWQRVEGIFEIASGSSNVTVTITNDADNTAYVDDFRIHPLDAAMSTTVYHPNNLLPIATHDNNNYTTFYNYDENNQLVRMRVETVNGIFTTSETSSGIRKRYIQH